jgi:hypothetical protein
MNFTFLRQIRKVAAKSDYSLPQPVYLLQQTPGGRRHLRPTHRETRCQYRQKLKKIVIDCKSVARTWRKHLVSTGEKERRDRLYVLH